MIERSLTNLTAEERKKKRLELEKPVLEAFWCWLETLQVLKGSALGKAVAYAKKQKPYLKTIFWMVAMRFQTMQQKMPFVHLL